MRVCILSRLLPLAPLSFATAVSRPEARGDDSDYLVPYSLPDANHSNATLREAGIKETRTTWTYELGIGGGPFSPAGPSGLAAIQRDALIYRQEGGAQLNVTRADNASAVASIDKVTISICSRSLLPDCDSVQWP